MKRSIYPLALAALCATAIGNAHAADSHVNDALAVESAKIGLTQAVTAAERHVGGTASRAEFEKHGSRWVFDVEVVKGNKVMDVKVDPRSGEVIAATEDDGDGDDAHDPAD